MEIAPFLIEEYYAKHEFSTRYMLSSSDCQSRTIGEVLDLEPDAKARFLELWCGYTEAKGAPSLREALAGIYEGVDPNNVLVTSCAEEGILLFYHALLRAGDHAIVEAPCYGSALDLARSTGAQVSEWRRRYEDGWAHDLDALEQLVRPNTRALYINTPHNPTGMQMTREVFDGVVEFARSHDLVLFSDEVYRELEHAPEARLPAACELYEKAISLGSVSKTYGLPGLRLGWLVSRDDHLREAMLSLKHYTTICSSAPSEFLVEVALRNRELLVERNLGIVKRNLPLLREFFSRHEELFEWIEPIASPIGFPRFEAGSSSDEFCSKVADAVGVLLLPGSVYGESAHIRFGFGREDMNEALSRLDDYIAGSGAAAS